MKAWYSKKASQYGTSFYRTPDGKEVEVTAVNTFNYCWDDAVCLSEDSRDWIWVRQGIKSDNFI